jgi:hypothetical protein
MTAQSFTTDNLKTLLGFPFQDDNWKNKFLIGSLIVFAGFVIPWIPFFFLYGYLMHIMRHIIVDKGKPHLPAWDDWGKLLVDGLKLMGVVLIYMLPAIVPFMIGFFIMFLVPMLGIPLAAVSGEENPEVAGTVFGLLTIVSMMGYFVLFGLGMALVLAIGVILPAVLGHVVATDDFGAAFRFKEWWAIFRANLGGFLLAYLILIMVSMVVNSVLVFLYHSVLYCTVSYRPRNIVSCGYFWRAFWTGLPGWRAKTGRPTRRIRCVN